MRGQGLYKLYRAGGERLLAYRLNLVFRVLDTPEKVTLHNEVVDEVLDILSEGHAKAGEITKEEKSLFDYIAEILLRKRAERKNFLRRVATRIMSIAQKKG
jgi:hypothetical protein